MNSVKNILSYLWLFPSITLFIIEWATNGFISASGWLSTALVLLIIIIDERKG